MTRDGIEPSNAQTTDHLPLSGRSGPARHKSSQAHYHLQQISDHLQRYRELSSQGKWADAGKELDSIQQLVQK